MQEILPRLSEVGALLISPAAFGELSRRLPSEFAVQNFLPARTGLVGSSSGPEFLKPPTTGLRKTSTTSRSLVTTTMALRSLAEFQRLPARSSAMPSVPSRYGCATKTLSRQSVLGVKVASQPVRLFSSPRRWNSIFQIAPRAVSAM